MGALYDLLSEHRRQLIDRWLTAIRNLGAASGVPTVELQDRIPSFIDELVASLHPSALPLPYSSSNAREHGVQRLRLGFNVSEVVREYGALLQCVLDLAKESGLSLGYDDLRTLHQSINAGIAEAASEYVWQRDQELRRRSDEHFGFLAHELRNPLTSAKMAFLILQSEQQLGGRTAQRLERSLRRISDLVDNALTSAWLKVGAPVRKKKLDLGELLREIVDDSAIEAEWRNIRVLLDPGGHITIDGDPRLLFSAVGNAVRNGIKFSHPGSTVVVRALAQGARVRIEVEDGCGGLPPGKAEELLHSFVQAGRDQSGFGLGLAIARDAAEAHRGSIAIQDLPGKGCVVSFDLPLS